MTTLIEKRKTILLVAIGVYLLINALLFVIRMPQVEADSATIEFSKEGFTDINEMTMDNNVKVAETGKFELFFDEETTHIKVVNKITGIEWYSNPQEDDTFPGMIPNTVNRQRSTFSVFYVTPNGIVNNYANGPYSIENKDGLKTYSIKYLEDKVQVLYTIGDQSISYVYFPKYISAERANQFFFEPEEACLTDYEIRKVKSYYAYTEAEDRYRFAEIYENMSQVVTNNLYEYFYEKCGYTKEDLEVDNAMNEMSINVNSPTFEIAVEYSLNDDGLIATILRDSIVESEYGDIVYIDFLPYFGTASTVDEGFIFVPDGSGAILTLNNGKSYHDVYSKRVYGFDYGKLPLSKEEAHQKIHLPVFGLSKTNLNAAMIGIIDQGAAMTSIVADTSERIDSYNKVYPRFHFRETGKTVFGNIWRRYEYQKFTPDLVQVDFSVHYQFLNEGKTDYVDMAEAYREYLGLAVRDETDDLNLDLKLVGAYQTQGFFLGVPRDEIDTLTTFEQAESILQELAEQDIYYLSLEYEGWFNEGIQHSMPTNIDIVRDLGGKRDFEQLQQYVDALGYEFYPAMNIVRHHGYTERFGVKKYTTIRFDGNLGRYGEYDLARLDMSGGSRFFVLKPTYYSSLFERFLPDLNKLDVSSVALNDFGGSYAAYYDKRYTIYGNESIQYQLDVFETLDLQVQVEAAFAYALPYVNYVSNVPVDATLIPILDYQIPFYQLVLNGYIDYSLPYVNQSDHTLNWNVLKAIETGSNLSFVWTYDDSSELLETRFNYYYATDYRNWIDEFINVKYELETKGIYNATLVEHEYVSKGVFHVKYSNGKHFVVNYNDFAVSYDVYEIGPNSYLEYRGD